MLLGFSVLLSIICKNVRVTSGKITSLPLCVCLLYTHISTHWNTWLIRDCCSASNIITLLPTLVSMETSFQSWLIPDRCESAQTKKGGVVGVSLCLNMTKRTLWALCSPHTEVIKVYDHVKKKIQENSDEEVSIWEMSQFRYQHYVSTPLQLRAPFIHP